MNTNRISTQYARLTPHERFPLLVAAAARGDHQERERLIASARRVSWQTNDYFGHAQAFREVSDLHYMEMLHIAAQYFQSLGSRNNRDEDESQRTLDATLLFGFIFKVRLAGWRQFCREQKLDPENCWMHLPGYETIQDAEQLAERAAFTPKGALAGLKRLGGPEGELVTAEAVAECLGACFRDRIVWWNGDR